MQTRVMMPFVAHPGCRVLRSKGNCLLVVASSVLRRVFRAFRHRDFRLMWIGACVSTTGTFVQQFAQSWLVYDLTKNPFYLGP